MSWSRRKTFPAVAVLRFASLLLLDVSRLAIPHNAPERTSNRGLWRTSTHETSRNWPFDPAFDSHDLRPPERAIAAAEIWFEEADFNLVSRLECDSRLQERPHVGGSSNTTSLAIKTDGDADLRLSGGVFPTLHWLSNYLSQYECRVVGAAKCRSEEEGYDCWE